MKCIVLSALVMSNFTVYGMESQVEKKRSSTSEPTEKDSHESHAKVRDNKNSSRSSDPKVKKNSPFYEKHSLFDGGVFY